MHEALLAVRAARDRQLFHLGFERALSIGLLGSYMEMMNRGGSGGYSRREILLARLYPRVDVLGKPARPPFRGEVIPSGLKPNIWTSCEATA